VTSTIFTSAGAANTDAEARTAIPSNTRICMPNPTTQMPGFVSIVKGQ